MKMTKCRYQGNRTLTDPRRREATLHASAGQVDFVFRGGLSVAKAQCSVFFRREMASFFLVACSSNSARIVLLVGTEVSTHTQFLSKVLL